MIQVEVHGIGAGSAVDRLMNVETGLKAHLHKEGIAGDIRVVMVDRTQEHSSDPYPYIRIHHNLHAHDHNHVAAMDKLIGSIRKFSSLQFCEFQIIKLDGYRPPCRDGHLP